MLAAQSNLRFSVPLLIFISAAIWILLAVIQYNEDRNTCSLSPWLILGVAAIIRVMFVFRPPELSDDIYRYIWDGLQMVFGNNPYQLAPAHVLPQSQVAAEILPLVNHPDLVTIYPPGAQVVFLMAALLGHQTWVLKGLLSLMDLLSCVMIIRLLKQFDLKTSRSILYAWHPLTVLEISGSGHIDAAGIFFFFLSLSIAFNTISSSSFPDRMKKNLPVILSGLFYAWSCLIKLFPVLFFPILLKSVSRQYRHLFLAGVLSGGLLLCLPFFGHLTHMAETLFLYTRHWAFSGLSYVSLTHLHLSGDLSRTILGTLFLAALSVIWLRTPGSFFGRSSAEVTNFSFYSLYLINLAFLFFTPTLHPWYALYLISVLPFVPGLTGAILSWSVLLAYAVLIPYALTGEWSENALSTVLIWLGPFSAFFVKHLIFRLKPILPFKRYGQ